VAPNQGLASPYKQNGLQRGHFAYMAVGAVYSELASAQFPVFGKNTGKSHQYFRENRAQTAVTYQFYCDLSPLNHWDWQVNRELSGKSTETIEIILVVQH
jgi:hypothetical protein